MTTLETAADMDIETYVVARMRQHVPHWTFSPFPKFSETDYIATNQYNHVVGFYEIKSRKPSMSELQDRHPDGVLLKRRKYEGCSTLESMFNVPAWVMFAFGSGKDRLAAVRPHVLPTRPSVLTGRRDRGLATDEEPVVLIDWNDLEVWS